MNIRFLFVLAFAFANLHVPPSAIADDKKKKKPTQAELVQQWKLEETQRQQAAAQAAARKAAGQRNVPQNPGAPQGDMLIVQLYNHTNGPVQVVQVSADGSTVKDFGAIPPYGPPENTASPLQTRPGVKWAFVSNGKVLSRYTVDTGFEQEVHIRTTAAPAQPVANVPAQPAADGLVQVQITNRTGVPLLPIRYLKDGSPPKNFDLIQPGVPYTLRTRPGVVWTFSAGDQVIEGYIVEQAAVQQLVLGDAGAAPPPQPKPVVKNSPAPNNAQIQAFMKVHNTARAAVGVDPLTWSAELAAYAQEWADYLATLPFRQVDAAPHRPNRGNRGENMAWGSSPQYSPAQAAQAWLSEQNGYQYGPSNGSAGHYTQMVWNTTTQVGYGIARSADGRTYIVANYSPAGNISGQLPY